MSVNTIITRLENDTNRLNFERGRQNLGSERLDKQGFLQLLMAQLRYQDPLNPVKDSEFLSQQVQLTQVDKMEELVRLMKGNNTLSQASGLIGKQVDVKTSNGFTVTGTVESASFSNGSAGLLINGDTYTLEQVSKIYGNSN